jgi:hypothetical protein
MDLVTRLRYAGSAAHRLGRPRAEKDLLWEAADVVADLTLRLEVSEQLRQSLADRLSEDAL